MPEGRLRNRNKGAFTFVEILVAGALLAVVLSLVLGVFFQGSKGSRKLDVQLQALHTAFLVRSRIGDDLASFMPVAARSAVAAEGPALALLRVKEDGGAGVAGTRLDAELRPITAKVVYRFDRPSGRLLRNGRPVTTARFRKVTFVYAPGDPSSKKGEILEVRLAFANARDDESTAPGASRRLRFHCPHTTVDRAYDEYCR